MPFIKKLFFLLLDFHLLRTWHIHKLIRQVMAGFKTQHIHILDAGCGFGQYSFFFLRKFKNVNVTGVDISDSHIKRAANFFKSCGFKNAKFYASDLTNYRSESRYNIIISVDVMEHILEDQKVFDNFFFSLNPGGVLIINTPSDMGGSEAHTEHDHSFIDEHVRNGYSIPDITEKLKKSGFSEVIGKYTYGTLGHISWILSMKYPIMMLNASKLLYLILPFYLILVYPFCILMNFADLHTDHKRGTGLLVKATK
jgi:SAM-dependent methyltransferase